MPPALFAVSHLSRFPMTSRTTEVSDGQAHVLRTGRDCHPRVHPPGGAALPLPAPERVVPKEGVKLGQFGIFLLLSYAAGHLVAAIGNCWSGSHGSRLAA